GRIGGADTDRLADLVDASRSFWTDNRSALIFVLFTTSAREACSTLALVPFTFSSIETVSGRAGSSDELATISTPSHWTCTLQSTSEIRANSTILTGRSDASIGRMLTITTRDSFGTDAEVIICKIETNGVVLARFSSTRTRFRLAS
ncbi:hypothetical protein PFISCL1PPCAC_16603, partial [Pristionchus fissidentatus]